MARERDKSQMVIKHFDIKMPKTQPPDGDGWVPLWNGNWRKSDVWSRVKAAEADSSVLYAEAGAGEIGEQEFEIDCFLSILSDIRRDKVVLIEPGAGWGEWCVALDGAIKNRVIPMVPKACYCLAVEAEPVHCRWTQEHFNSLGVNGDVVHGAVFNKCGTCRFNTDTSPGTHYGQRVSFMHWREKSILLGFYNLLFGKALKVPMYTIDSLVSKYGLKHVDIVQMDVQYAECEVVEGCVKSIDAGMIDYFMISTHKPEYNDRINNMLCHKYNLCVNLSPLEVGHVRGFPPIHCQDGLMVFKRRGA